MHNVAKAMVLIAGMLALSGCVVAGPPGPAPGPYAHWVPGHYGPYGGWVRGHWA